MLNQLLSRHHACAEAREWAKGYPDLAAAWAVCPRADWMLWLAARGIGKPGSAAHRVRTPSARRGAASPVRGK